MLLTLGVFVVLCLVGFWAWYAAHGSEEAKRRKNTPRFPGPKGLPLIGNVHQLKPKNPWLNFYKWSLEFGPIYQVNLAGRIHVWISDEDIAHDLLAKRSAMYSDRPHIPAIMHDNRDSGEYLPLMSKNEIYVRQRRFGKAILDESFRNSFYGYPELESRRMMKELLDNPKAYVDILEGFTTRVVSRLAWGTSEAGEELKHRSHELLREVSPTGSLANKLPFVMALPEIISPARAWERKRMETERHFFLTMQEHSARSMASGNTTPSWMKTFLANVPKWNFDSRIEGAYAVGMHGIAGGVLISAPMQTWILAMCHYPQYLPKLQAEIDRVCGKDNPPTFAHLPRLPYLRACIRESERWRPTIPTGIPHECTEDNVYNGVFVAKGTCFHPLEWSFTRNPAKYPQPETYNPERWLDPSYPSYQEPLTKYPAITGYSQFGHGIRICQGQGLVEADLFVGIGALAWAFDIKKAVSKETGLEIEIPDCDFTELLIAFPEPFEFDIKPRSPERRAKIMEFWEQGQSQGVWEKSRMFFDEKTTPGLGWNKRPTK